MGPTYRLSFRTPGQTYCCLVKEQSEGFDLRITKKFDSSVAIFSNIVYFSSSAFWRVLGNSYPDRGD